MQEQDVQVHDVDLKFFFLNSNVVKQNASLKNALRSFIQSHFLF